jgi:hypothetical protein
MVEGIPGSGKSTFAKKTAEFYTKRGLRTNLYNEGDYHPADLAWNACIPIGKLESVLSPYADFRDEINKNIHIEDGYAIISYTQIKTENQTFYKDMESYEVYDNRVPFEVFETLHHKRWEAFGKYAKSKNELTVFECAFLQNHISQLMMWQLADVEIIIQHLNKLLQTVTELSPILVYLSQPDIRETIKRVAAERVSEYGSWLDGFISSLENTPYGKKHGLKGFDGAIKHLESRKSTELKVIETLLIETIVLENPNYDWDNLWTELEKKLPV